MKDEEQGRELVGPGAAATAWAALRRATPARIGLGRVGASMPTAEVLGFSLAHARARDAVGRAVDTGRLAGELETAGLRTVEVRSKAGSRTEYLARPDLGRRLDPASLAALSAAAGEEDGGGSGAHEGRQSPGRLTIIIADGLSAGAASRHGVPLLLALREVVERGNEWSLDTVVIATGARVALADEIGVLREAEAVVIALGERPGLSSPESLGLYMTYAPRLGRMDAERNCISNVHGQGLGYEDAAQRLLGLLRQARLLGASGVCVKDLSDAAGLPDGRAGRLERP